MQPRRFTRAIVVVALAVLCGIGVLNVAVDPLAEFGLTDTRPLVRPARRTKVNIVKADATARAFVLGSSRAMKVEPRVVEDLAGLPAMNVAVNTAGAEDYFVMLRFLLDVAEPELLIVGVDEAAFHENTSIDQRLYGVAELTQYLHLRDRVRVWWSQFESALSLGTLVASLRSLRLMATGYPEPNFEFDDRGFLTYLEWEAEIADGVYDFAAARQKSTTEYQGRLARFENLSEWRLTYFEEFLALARERDVRIYLYTTPLHPQTEAQLTERDVPVDDLRDKVSRAVADLAEQYDAVFFDAARAGLGDEFYDGAHPRESLNRAILTALFAEGNDAL